MTSNRSVVVTGAAGFVGSHLVRRLVELGRHAVALVRPNSNVWRIRDVLDQVEIVEADLSSLEVAALETRLAGATVVYHLGAAGVDQATQDALSTVQTNVVGTLQLLQLARSLEVERLVYCGSCFEYPPGLCLSESLTPAPLTEYGASKAAGWLLVNTFGRKYGLPVVSLRPFTAYGPFEAPRRLVPYSIMQALDGEPIELTSGEQTRDFVFVEDVVEALLVAGEHSEAVGGTYNVCTGRATSVREVVLGILELTGSQAVPLLGARAHRRAEMLMLSGDPSRARLSLGWSAQVDLRDGLARTIQWFAENRERYPVYWRPETSDEQ